MCFSATASLVAGFSLSAVGVVTVKKAKRKAEIPFALVPILFGIQQIIEGLVWLSFRFNNLPMNVALTHVYLLFAYTLWPIYIPFVVLVLETVPWRKKILFFFQLIGIMVGVYLLYSHVQFPVNSQIINKSIVYSVTYFYIPWVTALYFMATCISPLFSSRRFINIAGVLGFIFAAISYQFYTISFVSVWCFFAAILSAFILLYFYYFNNTINPAK